jgi:hypothetical protein
MAKTDYRFSSLGKRIADNKALSGFTLLTFIGSLIGIIVGWHDLVPRLGAVLVALGTLWEFKVVQQVRNEREQSVTHFILVEANKRADEHARYQAGTGPQPPFVTSDFSKAPANFAITFTKEISLITLTSGVVIVFGTLLWAFGDWVSCSISLRAFSTC